MLISTVITSSHHFHQGWQVQNYVCQSLCHGFDDYGEIIQSCIASAELVFQTLQWVLLKLSWTKWISQGFIHFMIPADLKVSKKMASS